MNVLSYRLRLELSGIASVAGHVTRLAQLPSHGSFWQGVGAWRLKCTRGAQGNARHDADRTHKERKRLDRAIGPSSTRLYNKKKDQPHTSTTIRF